jgi:hypothetical protein
MQKSALIIGIIFILISGVHAQTTFRTKFMEGHYTYILNPSVNFNGEKVNTSQFGAGVNFNVGTEHISSILEYSFTRMNMKNLKNGAGPINNHEFYLGLRYYPMKPTFLIGRTALRITAGAAGGLDLEPNWRAMIFCGFHLSPILDSSGLAIYLVYRPGKHSVGGYEQQPTWAIRISAVLGVSAK